MFKNVLATLVFMLALTLAVPVQAQDVSSAIARMDIIIKEMERLRAEFALLATQVSGTSATAPTPTVQGAATTNTLTMDLSYGETNEDIARIQRLLATDPEIYPYGVDSGFFGPKTEEAIKNLQARNGWDTPGVVGPATRELLEGYFAAYPDENYPADVLKSKPPVPAVQGVRTSVTPTPATISVGTNPAEEINVQIDGDEALVEILYTNGNRNGLIIDSDDEDEIVAAIAGQTVLSRAQVSAVIDFDEVRNRSDDDYNEDDAEDALDDAEEAIEDAEDEIDEADEDGDDVDWAEDTLEEAEDLFDEAEEAFDDEDWDEAVELAEEAKELAEKAEDRIDEEENNNDKGDSDEIDEIEVNIVDEDEAEVTVKYDDDDDYDFEVEEDRKENIIEEIADELDISEDDVEDLVEFDYGDIDKIEAIYETGRMRVEILFESGVGMRLMFDEDLDEDEVIEEIADELDEDEDEVEDVTNFEYDN